jgi:hypothetical protein
MTDIRYTNLAISADKDGTWLKLCVHPSDIQKARRAVLERKDKVYVAELKEHREKRSLDANAMLWVMLDKLAEALGDTKESLYIHYIKEVGIFRDFYLTPEEANTFRTSWSMLGLGWHTEQVDYAEDGDRVMIRAYYGSSTYKKKQMARILDSVIADCKAVGIETLPPEKLALIKEEWQGCIG